MTAAHESTAVRRAWEPSMMRIGQAFSVVLLAVLTASPLAAQTTAARAPRSSGTALDKYVAAPDPAFAWKVVRDLPGGDGLTATLIDLTSQRWLTEQEVEQPLWTHWLTVVRPAGVKGDIGVLFISGGSLGREPPAVPTAWLAAMARDTGTVVAELRLVPNQPIVFKDDPARKPRTEDDFIAYTWNHFIQTGDDRWPAR